MIVLDTNVLSELMRKRPEDRVLAWVDAQDATTLATTAISIAELRYGVARLPDGVRRDRLRLALDELVVNDFSNRVLSFDREAADRYGEVVVERDSRGRPISMADAQIAAICHSRKATLATRDVDDFDATGIDLVDPWRTG